jgi:hypothetical protein
MALVVRTATVMNTYNGNDSTQAQLPLQAKRKFFMVAEILPSRIYRNISKNAQRVYGGIWNRLNNSMVDSVWISNENICRMTRLPEKKLDSALSELSRAGLLEIVPGLIQNNYRILDPDAPQQTEFEKLWDTQN